MNCIQCRHPEADHGPESGRWQGDDGTWTKVIPGRLCFYMENRGYQQDLCPCSGYDLTESRSCCSWLETAMKKAGVTLT